MAVILVVDDETTTLKVLRNVLVNAGHQVICASDGTRALEVIEDNPHIELMITDVIMPKLDGRDLIAAIRRESKYDKLPIIIMSATVKVKEIMLLLDGGASRFLAKPVQGAHLLAEVEACLHPPTEIRRSVP